ncbi:MAG: RES family NAD+ phosphorylase, partial [Sciscionella sp.]
SWWRHVPTTIDASARPDPPGDNRWQRGHIVDALYLADSESCAWAEWYRHLAEAAMPPNVALPRDLWRYEVATLQVADLSDVAQLDRVGLSLPHPGRRGWPAIQAIGEQLQGEGWRGLLAPSAARPASHVLAVFLPGSTTPSELVIAACTRIAQPPVPPTGMRT